jgi:hypothetical protein
MGMFRRIFVVETTPGFWYRNLLPTDNEATARPWKSENPGATQTKNGMR